MEKKSIEEEIKKSYLEYAMSVIVSRALPDVRDGLKPVQRRLLFSMNEMGFTHDKPYRKSARIVGDTMGKYHPHGDSAIYEALARMAQDFTLRYPLIDGQGNFGSIDGDAPAAMRYTEARLGRISEDMLMDLDKETVNFRLNFDGSLNEPDFLPSMIPNLIINGASGIAVGMATNILPHNLSEVCDAISLLIKNPEAETKDIMKHIKGPDFPGGGIVFFSEESMASYETGRGKIVARGEVNLEEKKKIVITSIPYGVNKSAFLEKMANQVKDEILTGITDIRDESSREGMRIVIKIRDDETKGLVLNQLYAHTDLEQSTGIINLVLVNNVPKILGIKGILGYFIEHRLSIILKRSTFELKKLKERDHLLSGIEKALGKLDRTIEIIRASRDPSEARKRLIEFLEISEIQANAILDMRLQRLTSLEIEKIKTEIADIRTNITRLEEIISSESKRREIALQEIAYVKKQYGDKRRTNIIFKGVEVRSITDVIPLEECVLILTEKGFLKRIALEEYRAQRRGGKGIITSFRSEDFPKNIMHCTSHDSVLFFTNTGRVLKRNVYEIETKSRKAVGVSLSAILNLSEGEVIKHIMRDYEDEKGYLIVTTRNGKIKKLKKDQLKNIRSNGLRLISLNDDDEVVAVESIDTDMPLVVVSSAGKASMFNSEEVRSTGRGSMGVKAMRLKAKDRIISAFSLPEGNSLLTVSSNGIGKRTNPEEFQSHRRGTGGVLCMKQSKKTGPIAIALPVKEGEDIIIMTKNEMTIRINVSKIKLQSRVTSGVKLISLNKDDEVIAIGRIGPEDE